MHSIHEGSHIYVVYVLVVFLLTSYHYYLLILRQHDLTEISFTQMVGTGGLVVGGAALQLLSAGGGLRVLQPAVHTNGELWCPGIIVALLQLEVKWRLIV